MFSRFTNWIKTKFSQGSNLLALISLGREFADLVKTNIDAAEDKAMEMLKLFLPAIMVASIDKLIDAIIDAVEAGIELFPMIRLYFTKEVQQQTDPSVLAPVMLATLGSDAETCLSVLEMETSKVRGEGDPQPVENPLVIIAIAGLMIQAIDFIIKRRRERRQDKK